MSNKIRWETLNASSTDEDIYTNDLYSYKDEIDDTLSSIIQCGWLNDIGEGEFNLEGKTVFFNAFHDEDSATIELIDTDTNSVIRSFSAYAVDEYEDLMDVYIDDKEESLCISASYHSACEFVTNILEQAGLNSEEDIYFWFNNGGNSSPIEKIYHGIEDCILGYSCVDYEVLDMFKDDYSECVDWLFKNIIYKFLTYAESYYKEQGFNFQLEGDWSGNWDDYFRLHINDEELGKLPLDKLEPDMELESLLTFIYEEKPRNALELFNHYRNEKISFYDRMLSYSLKK